MRFSSHCAGRSSTTFVCACTSRGRRQRPRFSARMTFRAQGSRGDVCSRYAPTPVMSDQPRASEVPHNFARLLWHLTAPDFGRFAVSAAPGFFDGVVSLVRRGVGPRPAGGGDELVDDPPAGAGAMRRRGGRQALTGAAPRPVRRPVRPSGPTRGGRTQRGGSRQSARSGRQIRRSSSSTTSRRVVELKSWRRARLEVGLSPALDVGRFR